MRLALLLLLLADVAAASPLTLSKGTQYDVTAAAFDATLYSAAQHHEAGVAYDEAEQLDAAVASFRHALGAKRSADSLANLGVALSARAEDEDLLEAAALLAQSAALEPGSEFAQEAAAEVAVLLRKRGVEAPAAALEQEQEGGEGQHAQQRRGADDGGRHKSKGTLWRLAEVQH